MQFNLCIIHCRRKHWYRIWVKLPGITMNCLQTNLAHPTGGLESKTIPLFSQFFIITKQWVPTEYHIHIWQVSLQLCCSDTCQIWLWFKGYKRNFCKLEISSMEKLTNGALVGPHPSPDLRRPWDMSLPSDYLVPVGWTIPRCQDAWPWRAPYMTLTLEILNIFQQTCIYICIFSIIP